jgi:F-type H+-transporting ATPase subunit b
MSMKLFCFLLTAALAFAAEDGGEHHQPDMTAKWINFGILAVGIGYLIAKFLMPALQARAAAISKDLVESKATVEAAEAKIAQLTAKLSNFDAEIQSIRDQALAEREAEGARIAAQTQSLLAKVAAHRQAEIESTTQAAQSELRAFTVEKALELAQARLSSLTDPATQGALVSAFLNDLKKKEAR